MQKMKIYDLNGEYHDIEYENDIDDSKTYTKIGYISTRIELIYCQYEIFIFKKDDIAVVELWDPSEIFVKLLARNPLELTEILLKFSQIVRNLVGSQLVDQRIRKMDEDEMGK